MKLIFTTNYLLVLFSLLLLLPNFFPYHFVKLSASGHPWEQFDPALTKKLRSVSDVLQYTDSVAAASKVEPGTIDYGVILNRVVKKRFYHGYSYYSLNENWMAAMAGKFIWDDLSAIVLPDDILKYPMAACSQQCIVLMECFKRKNISYRKVGFDHHFAVEGEFKNHWYYFDPDMEPDFGNFPRVGIDSIIRCDGLPVIYKLSLNSLDLKKDLGHHFIGKPNKPAAPNALIFHRVTRILSKTVWLLPFVLSFVSSKREKREKQKTKFKKTEVTELRKAV